MCKKEKEKVITKNQSIEQNVKFHTWLSKDYLFTIPLIFSLSGDTILSQASCVYKQIEPFNTKGDSIF